MNNWKTTYLLRLFITDNDKYNGESLHKVIVKKAHAMNMKGASVIHGILGFGSSSKIHSSNLFNLSEGLPLIIEIIDTNNKIDEFLFQSEDIMQDVLVTRQEIELL